MTWTYSLRDCKIKGNKPRTNLLNLQALRRNDMILYIAAQNA